MKFGAIRMLVMAASLLLSGTARAALISTLSFAQPTGTVGSADTIDIWVTLSLSSSSDPLVFDGSILYSAYPYGLDPSMIPSMGSSNPGSNTVPFASYTGASKMSGWFCTGTFTSGCGAGGAYTLNTNYGTDSWIHGGNSSTSVAMAPGESRNFLIGTLTPTAGYVTPGDYIFYNIFLGFSFQGRDANGNSIYASTKLASTCESMMTSCAFTRTVTAVPLPGGVWLLGSGLLGLGGVARRKAA